MAKYGVFLKPTTLDRMVVVKTTVASPADSDWDSQDGEVDFKAIAVKSLWAEQSDKIRLRYLFDVSDAGPTDPGSVWTNDSNAFIDNIAAATTSTTGSSSSNYLEGEGTAAPASGPTIASVKLIVQASEDGPDAVLGVRVTTDAAGETLLDITQALTTTPTFYEFTLTTPSGGWTYAKLQALEIRFWRDSGTAAVEVARANAVLTIEAVAIGTQQENGRVAYHVFDPETDKWLTKNEEVAKAGDTNFDIAPSIEAVSLALRSNGDVVLVAAYNDNTNERLRVFTRQEDSWTNEGEASGGVASTNYAGVVAFGPDASDRISWAYGDTTNDDIDLRSIASNDSISAVTEIDPAADTATLLVAPGVIDSADKIYVPYIDADDQISVADWASGVSPTVNLATSIGDNTVYGHGRTTAPFVAACLAIDGTDVHLLYANDADQDLYHDNDVDGGGATDNEELDAVTVNRISCKKGTSDLLYFYDDGGTTKYGTVSLGGADTTIAVPQDSLAETDNVPGINTGVTVAPPQDSLTETDNDPALSTGANVPVPQDALSETDNAPTVPQIVGVPQDSLAQTDQVPGINTGVKVGVPADALTQADNVPGINTGVTVAAPQDSLSQTDNAPGVGTGVSVAAPQDALSQADNTPSLRTGVAVETPQDALVQTDNDPALNTGVSVATPTDALAQTDNAPTIGSGTQIDVPQDSLSQTDNIPALSTGVNVETPQDSLAQIDNAPLASTGVLIPVPVDTLSVVDNDPGIATGVRVEPPADALSIADQVPGVATGVKVITPQDIFTLVDHVPVIIAAAAKPLAGSLAAMGVGH